jgi:hypothetical protein
MDTRVLSTIANVSDYKATEDWWFYLPSILLVNTILIFIVRFMSDNTGIIINKWYDEFGISAVMSDVSSIAITIIIARYIYTSFFVEQEGWSIWYFMGLAVVIKTIYDLVFAFGIVPKIPKRHNSMIDLYKVYFQGGPYFILTDVLMVTGSIGLASFLKNQDFHYTSSLAIVTTYALSYILFTNIK